MRSNRGRPTPAANSLIWVETAGCVRCSSCAAREKFMWRAAARNTRSCRRVTCFIAREHSAGGALMYIEKHMSGIESFDFCYGDRGRSLTIRGHRGFGQRGFPPKDETVTATVTVNDSLAAELAAYN